jgi:hypothetical protein
MAALSAVAIAGPLFLLREKGKRTEMTGTQHVGTLKHQFLHNITIKLVLVILYN